MKVSINMSGVYHEAMFYLNWARKSSNRKTKRKLIIKALKEVKFISEKKLRKRLLGRK